MNRSCSVSAEGNQILMCYRRFRDLTRNERFLLAQIVVARLQIAQPTPHENYCEFGCTDCGRLKWKDLDFENSRVQLARNKTGVCRNLPLWPETIQALKELPRSGELVFYTSDE